jgi:hypothetical protein
MKLSMLDDGKKTLTRLQIHQCHFHIVRERHEWKGIENFSKGTASFDYTLIKLSLNTKQGAMETFLKPDLMNSRSLRYTLYL